MREHDAFGFTGAPAAENDGGEAIGRQRFGLPTGPFDDAAGSEESQQGGLKFMALADRFREVLQPED